MTEFVWPDLVVPTEAEWRLVDFTGAFANSFGGGVRTVSRGQRWACTLRVQNLGGFLAVQVARRHAFLAFLAQLRGRSNRVWLGDVTASLRGSFACPELLANSYPVTTVSPWMASNAEVVLTADGVNGLRATRTGVVANRTVNHGAITTVSGARYAFRALLAAGRGSLNGALAIGTTSGASDTLLGTTRTSGGRYVESFAAGATTLYPSLLDYTAGRSAGDFWHATGLSLSRCARVHTTTAAGATAMLMKDWPVSTAGLAVAGDLFEVGGELHRLTANLESDANGNGYAMFEPALRASQAADVPVILRDPMGRFLLAEEASWSTRPGLLSDISLTFMEA